MTSKNILLIEDELLIQKSLCKLLSRKGAIVDGVSMGEQALELLSQKKYDRVICDLMLQDITGFDIIEESKKWYSPEEIREKFVIITAYSSAQVLEKAKKYGCKILSKPFSDVGIAINILLGEGV